MSVRWIAAVLALTPVVAAAEEHCTEQQAIAAEQEAASLHTWAALFRSYTRYRQCDDGAIGEGYSESVSLLLANRWGELGEALKLFKAHPRFEKFVLSHVDLTVPDERLDTIGDHASHQCPRGGETFCKKLLNVVGEVG